jgi:hypothetical protein
MSEEPTGAESAEQALSDAVEEAIAEVDPISVLTSDLQRVQADFQNYRKRVDKEDSNLPMLSRVLSLHNFLGPWMTLIERKSMVS